MTTINDLIDAIDEQGFTTEPWFAGSDTPFGVVVPNGDHTYVITPGDDLEWKVGDYKGDAWQRGDEPSTLIERESASAVIDTLERWRQVHAGTQDNNTTKRYLQAVADDLIIAAKTLARAEKHGASESLLERLREVHAAADQRWYIANGFPLPKRFTR